MAERFYPSPYERTIVLKTRILCLFLAVTWFCCGCGEETPQKVNHTTDAGRTTTSTTNSNISTTTTKETIVETTTDTSIPVTRQTEKTVGITTTTSQRPSTTYTTGALTTTSTAPSETVTFKATIRDHIQQNPVGGVTVTVFTDGNASPAGSAITNQNGIASITIRKGNSYRVVLSTLPTGYEADAEYRFTSHTVNITIRKAAIQDEQDHSQAQYDIGKTMSNFSLTDTDGKTYRLSDLLKEKKLVILNFWFTSCGPCKMEFPFFEAAIQRYGTDMALLTIDPFDSVGAMVSLRNQLKVTFPMMQDTCKLAQGFDVTAFPTTVFIDSDGRILDIQIGSFPSESAFFASIERHLN